MPPVRPLAAAVDQKDLSLTEESATQLALEMPEAGNALQPGIFAIPETEAVGAIKELKDVTHKAARYRPALSTPGTKLYVHEIDSTLYSAKKGAI